MRVVLCKASLYLGDHEVVLQTLGTQTEPGLLLPQHMHSLLSLSQYIAC